MPARLSHRQTLLRGSVSLAARVLGVSRNTVTRWIHEGHLAGVEPEDLCAFLRAHGWRGRIG